MPTAVNKAGRKLVDGSFKLHALASFGSEDLNESLPRRANSQFASMDGDTGGDRLFV